MSNGGEMSYLLACEFPNYFRAVAPVAGTMMESWYNTCNPEYPTPIFEIHGTNDNVTWWDGDPQDLGGWGPYVGIWREKSSCGELLILRRQLFMITFLT
ncbi:MAG: hypothetical protein CM15mP64_4600 [Candidatus Neomarinimicrobiota bacterium]|nr:MAG: hypothetical protein CM15mP64_4600 [Candidatus Neomarinimicrobiota bacterium]